MSGNIKKVRTSDLELKDRLVAADRHRPHHPADNFYGLASFADVLQKENQAGKEEADRNPSEQQGSGGEAMFKARKAVD